MENIEEQFMELNEKRPGRRTVIEESTKSEYGILAEEKRKIFLISLFLLIFLNIFIL